MQMQKIKQLLRSKFADQVLVVTLLLIVTFLAAPIQMATARFSAIYTADGDENALAAIRRFMEWRRWPLFR